MNKRGFITRDFVIASILAMGVIALMILLVQAPILNYERPDLVDDSFSATYNQLDNVTSGVETILNTTRSGEGLTFRGAFDVAFGAAFTTIQLVFGSLSFLQNVFVNFAADFGIPANVAGILFIIGFSSITVVLIFVWLSSISRGKI